MYSETDKGVELNFHIDMFDKSSNLKVFSNNFLFVISKLISRFGKAILHFSLVVFLLLVLLSLMSKSFGTGFFVLFDSKFEFLNFSF